MHICLYTDTALPKTGGQEMVVDALARQFLQLGHTPIVLAPLAGLWPSSSDRALPYRVVRHPRFFSSRYFVGCYRIWLERLHRSVPFDILHCHGIYPPGYLAALCRQLLQVPTLITSHGGDLHESHARLRKPLVRQRLIESLRAADALVANSRFTRERFLNLCPDHPRVVDLPNGVDYKVYSTRVAAPDSLDPSLRSGEYALFLGRLHPRKGVDVLLEALAKVPQSGQVQLVIAGDGEARTSLERQATRLGLNQRVRFVGAVFGQAKTYLLQNALLTVTPSRHWEACPLVVFESYAAGKAVLATRVHGLVERVEAGRTGWLIEPEAPGELAQAIQSAFANRSTTMRMGAQARGVAQALGWRTVAKQHLALYQELRAGNPGGRLERPSSGRWYSCES